MYKKQILSRTHAQLQDAVGPKLVAISSQFQRCKNKIEETNDKKISQVSYVMQISKRCVNPCLRRFFNKI